MIKVCAPIRPLGFGERNYTDDYPLKLIGIYMDLISTSILGNICQKNIRNHLILGVFDSHCVSCSI